MESFPMYDFRDNDGSWSTPSRVWLDIRWKVEDVKSFSKRQITHSLCSIVPAHSYTKSLQTVKVTDTWLLEMVTETSKNTGYWCRFWIWDDAYTNLIKKKKIALNMSPALVSIC